MTTSDRTDDHRFFTLHARVPRGSVAAVLDLLMGEGCTIISLVEEAPTPAARVTRYAGGRRDKGISCRALVLKTLNAAVDGATEAQLKSALRSNDPPFAIASLSPTKNELLREGAIFRDARGRYHVTPTTPPQPLLPLEIVPSTAARGKK